MNRFKLILSTDVNWEELLSCAQCRPPLGIKCMSCQVYHRGKWGVAASRAAPPPPICHGDVSSLPNQILVSYNTVITGNRSCIYRARGLYQAPPMLSFGSFGFVTFTFLLDIESISPRPVIIHRRPVALKCAKSNHPIPWAGHLVTSTGSA